MCTSLDTTIKAKANNSEVVYKSGDETISGIKIFGKQDNVYEGCQIDLEKCTNSRLSTNVSIDTIINSLRFFAKNSDVIYTTFGLIFKIGLFGVIVNMLRDIRTQMERCQYCSS